MTLITNLDVAHVNQVVRGLDSVPDSYSVRRQSVASWQRPANATAYVDLEVISDSEETAKVIRFPNCVKQNGGSGTIRGVLLHSDVNYAVDPQLELLLFTEEPTNQADNVAIALSSVDLVVGKFNLPTSVINLNASASPAGSTLHKSAEGERLGFVCESDDNGLFGLLISRSSWTPVSEMKIHILLDLGID